MRVTVLFTLLTLAACGQDTPQVESVEEPQLSGVAAEQSLAEPENPPSEPDLELESEIVLPEEPLPLEPLDLTLPKDLFQHAQLQESYGATQRLPNLFGMAPKEKMTKFSGKVLLDEEDPTRPMKINGAQFTIEKRLK